MNEHARRAEKLGLSPDAYEPVDGLVDRDAMRAELRRRILTATGSLTSVEREITAPISTLRSVLLKGAPDIDQMSRVSRGFESPPETWPANWEILYLIAQALDFAESYEIEANQWRDKAVQLRAIYIDREKSR